MLQPDRVPARTLVALVLGIVGLSASFSPLAVPAFGQSDSTTSRPGSVQLIIDASASMAWRLPDGTPKIEAVRTASKRFMEQQPDGLEFAVRAWGSGSRRGTARCDDTALLSEPAPASVARTEVSNALDQIAPEGLAPIARSLELGARDTVRRDDRRPMLIAISDSRDTCGEDPCASARQLRAQMPGLVIHTVGLSVDAATGAQLQCVADVTGGSYFAVDNTAELAAAMLAAAQTHSATTPDWEGGGRLELPTATTRGHEVRDTRNGEIVALLSSQRRSANLPAGIYNVAMGPVWWQSVRVATGRTTVLRPGLLTVRGASIDGHQIRDAETGQLQGTVSTVRGTISLVPGTYSVSFGESRWPGVRVDSARRTVLEPGLVEIDRSTVRKVVVKDEAGRIAGITGNKHFRLPLPPGRYTVEIDDREQVLEIQAGKLFKLPPY